MRLILFCVLILATGALAFQLYHLVIQKKNLALELDKTDEQIKPLQEENKGLLADLEYFQSPESLEIEMKKAGYALPGEKMLIIIPPR